MCQRALVQVLVVVQVFVDDCTATAQDKAKLDGHVCRAMDQTVVTASLSQSIRMWSRDSGAVLQLAQWALWACCGILSQNWPIWRAPLIAL